MTTVETNELLDLWGRVSRWPEPMKLSLATKTFDRCKGSKPWTRSNPGLALEERQRT